jgi:hypothetical protein
MPQSPIFMTSYNFDNIVIEHKKIKITKNGILKGVKSKI